MKRGTRTNLLLIVIVGALAALVYRQVDREQAAQEPPLSALDPGTVARIGVRCAQCTPREFTRDNARWLMQQPYALEADEAIVNRLLSIATMPVRSRRPIESFDLTKIGLAPPLMTLELDTRIFEIGLTDILRGDRYVRVGDIIAMAPDRFSPFLMATPESELDRHLSPRSNDIVALRIDGVLAPQRMAAWREVTAAKISVTQASAILRDDAIRVELLLADGQAVVYRIQRSADGYHARRDSPPLDYLLEETQIGELIGPPRAR